MLRKRLRTRVLGWAMASLLAFAGVVSADCTIHAPTLHAFTVAQPEDAAPGDEGPGDHGCLAPSSLSSIECSALDAAWSAPALLAELPAASAFASAEARVAAPLGDALLPPLPEPVFRRVPRLLI